MEFFNVIEQSIQELLELKLMGEWGEGYRHVEVLTQDLHRILEDLRLLIYLGGVCDVCSRFSE